MIRSKARLRSIIAVAMRALTALSLAVPAASGAGDGDDRRLTPAAKKAGITLADGAYLGWKTPESTTSSSPTMSLSSYVAGIDVSRYQGNVDWAYWWGQGKRFAYVKATEGTYYTNPYFAQQYNGSYNIGMIRGSYHFANPTDSSGYTHLHGIQLVVAVHGQLDRVQRHQPPVGGALLHLAGHPAGRLAVLDLLAVHLQPARPGLFQRFLRPAQGARHRLTGLVTQERVAGSPPARFAVRRRPEYASPL